MTYTGNENIYKQFAVKKIFYFFLSDDSMFFGASPRFQPSPWGVSVAALLLANVSPLVGALVGNGNPRLRIGWGLVGSRHSIVDRAGALGSDRPGLSPAFVICWLCDPGQVT